MDINKACKVTNASGTTIVVLNAANASTNVAQNSVKQGYLQELTLLDVGSGKTIASGETGTVTLDGTYTDSKGQTRPAFIYDLLISKPDSLFPVMAIGKSLNFKTLAYDPITVSADAAKNMVKGLNFCTNIMTSPSSKMATSFQAAMSEALKKNSVPDMEAAVAQFFNQYDLFKGLDFTSYVAVSTWLRAFAYRWGLDDKGNLGQTYYVYSAGKEGGSATISEGQIIFAKRNQSTSPADPSDPNSGMDITLESSDGSKTALTFSNGQLIDSEGGAIALYCTFGYKGAFTKKDADTTVWPMMTGTMVGKKVLVIPLAPESGWDKFWSSLTFEKLLGYFLQAMGVWMAIDFLKQKLSGKENKLNNDEANENQGEPPDANQQQQANESADSIGEQALNEDQTQADRASGSSGEVKVPANDSAFSSAVDSVRSDGAAAYNSVATDNVSGGINSARTQLDDLSSIAVTESIEEAEGNLVDATTSLKEGNLGDASKSLGEVSDALPNIVEELGTSVTDSLKQQVSDAVAAQEEAKEVADEADETADDAGSGEEEPFEEPIDV